jgi:hypothetical protein
LSRLMAAEFVATAASVNVQCPQPGVDCHIGPVDSLVGRVGYPGPVAIAVCVSVL